jgi:hypothetical protein
VRAVLVIAALIALAGCGGDGEGVGETGAREETTGFTAAGCPIDDPELCVRAAAAATALQQGDTGRLVELSYADTFVCEDLRPDLFPDCSPGATLEGHAVTGADGKIGVLSAEDYEARLAELGEVTVAGVGTCGPDDPDRRSYHLAFWTASRDEGGSLELVRRQSEWSIGIIYADKLANWKTVYDDPETELACGNVQPWG